MNNVATPNFGQLQNHLMVKMEELVSEYLAEYYEGEAHLEDENFIRKCAFEYMTVLSALNFSAQIVGTTQSVFDHYICRMGEVSKEERGATLVDAMKDLRLASSR